MASSLTRISPVVVSNSSTAITPTTPSSCAKSQGQRLGRGRGVLGQVRGRCDHLDADAGILHRFDHGPGRALPERRARDECGQLASDVDGLLHHQRRAGGEHRRGGLRRIDQPHALAVVTAPGGLQHHRPPAVRVGERGQRRTGLSRRPAARPTPARPRRVHSDAGASPPCPARAPARRRTGTPSPRPRPGRGCAHRARARGRTSPRRSSRRRRADRPVSGNRRRRRRRRRWPPRRRRSRPASAATVRARWRPGASSGPADPRPPCRRRAVRCGCPRSGSLRGRGARMPGAA